MLFRSRRKRVGRSDHCGRLHDARRTHAADGSVATVTSVGLTAGNHLGDEHQREHVHGGPRAGANVTVTVAATVSSGAQTGQLAVVTSGVTVTVPLSYVRVM